MKIINRKQIESVIDKINLLEEIEQGFAEYSKGNVVVPPIGELLLEKGEVHIKYGFVKNDSQYVIKIASGFYDNPLLGIPSSNGLMLVFNQNTGELAAILLDEGFLTDIRTAVAGSISSKYFSPKKINCIGIVGTGIQARLQLQHLKSVTKCRQVIVWGRNSNNLEQYVRYFKNSEFNISPTLDITKLTNECNLIVTTTPTKSPILLADQIKPGTHITAVGSDTPEKNELDSKILVKASSIIADSKKQCLQRGEIYHAIQNKLIDENKILELGNVISGKTAFNRSEKDITVSDLTGVAVQDIKIAQAVMSFF